MTKFLSISNKLLSLRGNIRLNDESGRLAFEAIGEFAIFSATWRVLQGDVEVASICRRIFSIRRTWEIEGLTGHWRIKRKIFSFSRTMYVEGGFHNGATICGNIWDRHFSIEKNGVEISRAGTDILTLRDRHNIEVLSHDPIDLVLTVISMVVVQLDRRDEEA